LNVGTGQQSATITQTSQKKTETTQTFHPTKSKSTMKLNLLLLSAAALVNAATATESAVELGTAANYAILTKSGISTGGGATITGNIAVSPIAATAITGFGLTMEGGGQYSTAGQVPVPGQVFAASYGGATQTMLIDAVSDMQLAYEDAESRTTDPAKNEVGAGIIDGKTLEPGVYTFTSNIWINADITLEGTSSEGDADNTDVIIITTQRRAFYKPRARRCTSPRA
jgi:hypothetical protein